jgi:ferritin-like protein
MLDRETILRFQSFEKQHPSNDDPNPLAALTSVIEVICYIIACARAEGADEADHVELLLMDKSREELRKHAKMLKKLGYTLVHDRLREMARARRRSN